MLSRRMSAFPITARERERERKVSVKLYDFFHHFFLGILGEDDDVSMSSETWEFHVCTLCACAPHSFNFQLDLSAAAVRVLLSTIFISSLSLLKQQQKMKFQNLCVRERCVTKIGQSVKSFKYRSASAKCVSDSLDRR